MSEEFYFKTLGMEFGPVSLDEIGKMIDSGSLKPGDLIRSIDGSWTDVAQFSINPSLETPPVPASSLSKHSDSHSPAVPPHPPRPKYSPHAAPDSSEDLWLYQAGAKTGGPCSTEQFMAFVNSGVVTPHSLVKLVGDDGWTKAGDIPGLAFPEAPDKRIPPATPPHEKAVETEIRATVEPISRRQADSLTIDLRSRGIGARLPENETRPHRRVTLDASEKNTPIRFTIATGVRAILTSILFWSGAFIVLVICLVAFLPSTFMSHGKAFEQLDQIFLEFTKLKSNKVDSGEWNNFLQKANGELAAVIPFLEKKARGTDPVSISLLRVARDDFPRLFKERFERDSKIAEEIKAHLWVAERKFRRTPVFGSNLDILTAIVVALDVVGICTAAVFFGVKCWNRRFAGG